MADLTFRFGSTGADRLSRDMRGVADTSVIAARGARICADSLKTQERATNSLADYNLKLRKTETLLAIAEREVAKEADKAERAIRGEGRAAEAAAAKNELLARSLDNVADKAGASGRGIALALSPALIPIAAGLAAGIAAVGTSLGGALIGAGLFGKMASTVIQGAGKDAEKLQKLQERLAAATTAAQKKQIQAQITDLKAGMGQQYAQVVASVGGIKEQWKDLSQTVATPVLVSWLDAAQRGMTHLKPFVQPVADVFKGWGESIDRYFKSSAGSAELDRIASALGRFSASQLTAIGSFLTDAGKGIHALGQDLAAHGADFGAFGDHLTAWGSAFATWAQSDAARKDVGKFLDWLRTNGKTVGDLAGNLAAVMGNIAPGLTAMGQLELKLLTDFFGFVATLPPAVADTLGALLLLSKTGVISVGLKFTGRFGPALLKWLTGGLINIGGAATAAAEIQAAMVTGGKLAGAEIAAAMQGAGVAAGAEGAGVGAAAGAGAGAGAGAAGIAGLVSSPLAVLIGASAGIALALYLRRYQPAKGPPAGQMGPRAVFPGPGAPDPHKFWQQVQADLEQTGQAYDVAKAKAGEFAAVNQDAVNKALAAAGTHADALRISHLGPLGSKIDAVTHQTQILQGTIRDPAPTAAGGAHADTFRTQHLGPLQSKISAVDQQTKNLQGSIDALHGKTVDVGVHGTGSGGAKITVSSVGGGPFAGKLVSISNRALGGMIGGGVPGRDSVPAMLMPGELVVPTAMVQAGAVDHLKGRLPGFAAGGLVTPMPDVWGGRVEDSYGADARGAIGSAAAAAFRAVTGSVAGALRQAAASGYLGPGGGNYAGMIATVLTSLGLPLSLVANWLRQIQSESGGRLNAVNLTDINAQLGHPSVGLLQLIPSTFHSFAGPYVNTPPLVNYGGGTVSLDPMAQIYAAIHYANVVYHGAAMADVIGRGHGYAAGGLVGPGRYRAPTTRAWINKLNWLQAEELRDYGLLSGAFTSELARPRAHGWTWTHRRGLAAGLKQLTAAQKATMGAYTEMMTGRRGISHATRSDFWQAMNRELGVLDAVDFGEVTHRTVLRGPRHHQHKVRLREVLGHPYLERGVRWQLEKLMDLAATQPGYWQTPAPRAAVVPAGPRLHAFDTGGTLAPGWNLAWNGTGRDETLIPARTGGGGGGDVHIHLHNHGVVGSRAELDNWLAASVDRLARTGRMSYALRRSASA